MSQNDEMRDDGWTPYRELLRYRRLLMISTLINLALAAALVVAWRM
jgi:hypothetical protein